MTNILVNNRAIKTIKRDTTAFGWNSFKIALVSTLLSIVATVIVATTKDSHILLIVTVFLWIISLIASILVLDDVTTKNSNRKELTELLDKLARKQYKCDIESSFEKTEILLKSNRAFLFAHNSNYYIAGEYGCFNIEKPTALLMPEDLDEIYAETLARFFNKITNNRKNYVKAVQNGITLIDINKEYIIQKDDLAFEISEEDAQQILDGERSLETIFKRYLREHTIIIN